MQRTGALGAALVAFSWSVAAAGQGLPPLPPPAGASGPTPASEPGTEPAPESAPLPPPPPPGPPPPPPPIRLVLVEPPRPPVHAPDYSLWLGGRAGLLAYGGGLYINDPSTGAIETTGNFVKPGLGLELDVGARLARRYIPYLAVEFGLVEPGHRFQGATSSTTAKTTFLGFGFRYMAGDVDTVAFASDLSFGLRTFSVTSGGSTWSASGFEIFRLGLGAEIRVNSRFAVSPMLTLSGGSLSDTSGNVAFAPNQGDGQTSPAFTGSSSIPGTAQTTYYAVMFGCGAHVDLFGK
jgi:hypothetical protein